MKPEHYIAIIAALSFVNVFTTLGWAVSFWQLMKAVHINTAFVQFFTKLKERFPIEVGSVERELREKK